MSICIFCNSNGPFTIEHVLPFSLGGGGDGWTLHNCVCGDCNNAFSTLERELARRSIESLPRMAYGPEGRKRGGKSRSVPLYADGIYYLPPDIDLAFEAGLELGVQPYLRAQIIEVNSPEHAITGSDRDELVALFDRIENFAKNEFFIIIKTPTKKGEFFEISELDRDEKNQVIVVSQGHVHRVKGGAWLELFPTKIEGRRLTPRIFLDDEKRLVIRAEDLQSAISFLGPIINSVLDEKSKYTDQVSVAPSGSTGTGPQIMVYTHFNQVISARAIAKIGINFVASLYGTEFVLDTRFNAIKAFIRGEVNNSRREMGYHVNLIGDEKSPFDLIETPHTIHAIFVTYVKGRLLFGIRFYGSGGYVVNLGNKKPTSFTSIPSVADFLMIDYLQKETKLISFESYLKSLGIEE